MSLPNATASPILAGHRLSCRRGDRLVFDELDFELPKGGALVLTGPNGSGKSSLLRVMAGLTPALRGTLAWAGTNVTEDPQAHAARLHFIGHQDALKLALTAKEVLFFWAGIRGSSPAHARAALQRFRLDSFADWPCRFLSAGQRHRLALARLIASPAPLWLLDEPTTGLDESASTVLTELIAEHRAAGGCVAIATHLTLPIADAATLPLDRYATRRTA